MQFKDRNDHVTVFCVFWTRIKSLFWQKIKLQRMYKDKTEFVDILYTSHEDGFLYPFL